MKQRYRLYWSIHERAWACFHYDDSVKRYGAWLEGQLIAYMYETEIYYNPNKPIRSYSQL